MKVMNQYKVTHITVSALQQLAVIKDGDGDYILNCIELNGQLYYVHKNILFIPDLEEEFICVNQEEN